MALTLNREVDRYVDQELRTLPVKADAHVFKGAMVGLSSGFARPLEAGDDFAGVAYEEVNNTGEDGDKVVRVFTRGDFEHTLASAARANNGAAVYASADDTITLTSTDNSAVGRQVEVAGTNKIVLRIKTVFDT
jgi:predicted RecA/RadA family phage recombinase